MWDCITGEETGLAALGWDIGEGLTWLGLGDCLDWGIGGLGGLHPGEGGGVT